MLFKSSKKLQQQGYLDKGDDVLLTVNALALWIDHDRHSVFKRCMRLKPKIDGRYRRYFLSDYVKSYCGENPDADDELHARVKALERDNRKLLAQVKALQSSSVGESLRH